MSSRLNSRAERQLAQSLAVLGLKPGASERDVDRAIEVVRQTVTDPNRLREFLKAAHFVRAGGRRKRRRRSERHVSRFLLASSLVLVVLTAFSALQVATRFRHHFVRFEAGQEVFRVEDDKHFGLILGFEKNHRFPNGALRDAYNIRLRPDDKEAWISSETAQSALTADP